jgi:hypothetical protein
MRRGGAAQADHKPGRLPLIWQAAKANLTAHAWSGLASDGNSEADIS